MVRATVSAGFSLAQTVKAFDFHSSSSGGGPEYRHESRVNSLEKCDGSVFGLFIRMWWS
jgi:hypothetical protein